MVLTVALLVWILIIAYSSRGRTAATLEQLRKAQEEINTAMDENAQAIAVCDYLRFELQRTSDSMEILVAERDSAILSFKRWGSDEQYRRYNAELRAQTGELEALRRKYRNLITTREDLP